MRKAMVAAAMLLLGAYPAALSGQGPSAGLHKEALEAVLAALDGRPKPEAARRYFAKDAVFVGAAPGRWDVEKFAASLKATGCSTRGTFFSQDRVLNALAPDAAAELRKQGHPFGPGLSFYCASPKVPAGHTMITFTFRGAQIVEIRQAFYVQAPPPPAAPPRST